MSDQYRLILDPAANLELLEGAAQRAGWPKVLEDPRDGNRPHRVAWQSPWPGVRVYFVDDHLIKVPYVLIHGPGAEQLRDEVMETFPSHAWELALTDALDATESEDKKASIRRLAVLGTGRPVDPNFLGVFDAAFNDPDPEVRKVAIGASTYPAWREFEPRLEILEREDTDESVRELATRTLSALRRHNWV